MQRQVALEVQEQVLAARVHGRHGAAGEPLGPALGLQARRRGEDLVGDAPREDGRDTPGRVMDGVALGHADVRLRTTCVQPGTRKSAARPRAPMVAA